MTNCPAGYVKKTDLFGFRTRCVRVRSSVNRERRNSTRRNSARKSPTRKSPTRKNRPRVYIPSMKSLARNACPPGMIERKGYMRKYSNSIRRKGFTVKRSGTTYRVYPKAQSASVGPACVKDTGKGGPGIPKSIGPLRKGELSKYGYAFRKSTDERHEALEKAIKAYGALGVFRKLDAVYKLAENKLPHVAIIFRRDRNWVYSKYKNVKKVLDAAKH